MSEGTAEGRVVAQDDVVDTHKEAQGRSRAPLLVLQPLQAFLDEHRLGSGQIEAAPIGEGHSNVTYLLKRGELSLVLRRPPRPPLPPSAHDVLREARLLTALQGSAARVPKVLAVCEKEQVIGSPFYVMEMIEGEVIVSTVPPALDTPAQRRRMSEELIDALVEIHSVDWEAAGLQGFGKPTGYLERQLRRFSGLWEVNKTREIEEVAEVERWLSAHIPASARDGKAEATIVHGDFRLGNTIFCEQAPARLLAVLDWEMATIGDPLADLGYLCMMWTQQGDPDGGLRAHLGRVTRREGFLTRAQLIERYERLTGRSMEDLRWYTTLALWKTVVFMEGNYRRAVSGATDDPYLKQFGDGVLELARLARETAFGG